MKCAEHEPGAGVLSALRAWTLHDLPSGMPAAVLCSEGQPPSRGQRGFSAPPGHAPLFEVPTALPLA